MSNNSFFEKLKAQIANNQTANRIKKSKNKIKLKQMFTQPKVVSKLIRYTPSPFKSRDKPKEKLNQTAISSSQYYNKDTKKFNRTNYFKLFSMSRRKHSWDKSITDASLNDSKIFDQTIVKRNNKNKAFANLNTSNMSKTSISILNINEMGYSKYIQEDSIKENNEEVKNPFLSLCTDQKSKKAKPIGLKSLMITKNSIKPKMSTQISKNNQISTLKKQSNPSKKIISSYKKDSSHYTNEKKENTSTSFDSLITKETASKIKICEAQAAQSEKKERIIKKIKCIHDLSKTGLIGTEKKINQDSYFIFKNFLSHIDYIYMGVLDGHGLYGNEVSGYIRENLAIDLNHAIQGKKLNILTDDLTNVISQTFIHQNDNLRKYSMIDCKLSGTTCASAIYTPEKMILANLGDSRVVIGREIKGEWKHENLTRDHKPSERDEAERILKIGGRIRPMLDEDGCYVGPLRVYMKEKDIPGISMTRSFGDYYASTAGCISLPEITEYYFQQGDRFMVIATDGLWEFINSDEVITIVQKYYSNNDIVGCSEYLYKESCKRWLEEEEVIDDITLIIVFFEYISKSVY